MSIAGASVSMQFTFILATLVDLSQEEEEESGLEDEVDLGSLRSTFVLIKNLGISYLKMTMRNEVDAKSASSFEFIHLRRILVMINEEKEASFNKIGRLVVAQMGAAFPNVAPQPMSAILMTSVGSLFGFPPSQLQGKTSRKPGH